MIWPSDHGGGCPQNVVIVQHYPGSAKQYVEAVPFPGRSFIIPDSCPDPDCRAVGCLIRWGTYERSARTGDVDYAILIQRVRCQVCGRTHSLLPDFLHPYRHYVIRLLQHGVSLYLIAGLGWNRLLDQLPALGPARSTIREWVASFGYGAGYSDGDYTHGLADGCGLNHAGSCESGGYAKHNNEL